MLIDAIASLTIQQRWHAVAEVTFLVYQVGEFGSGLDLGNTHAAYQNEKDATFLHGVALYSNWMYAYLGVRISSWFWWCWNANTNGGLYLVGLNPSTDSTDYDTTTSNEVQLSPLPAGVLNACAAFEYPNAP